MKVGDKVKDIDRKDTFGYVTKVLDEKAEDVVISKSEKTVADVNQTYPKDDNVIEVVLDVDEHQVGIAEKRASEFRDEDESFEEVMRSTLKSNAKAYYYPESRLRVVD